MPIDLCLADSAELVHMSDICVDRQAKSQLTVVCC